MVTNIYTTEVTEVECHTKKQTKNADFSDGNTLKKNWGQMGHFISIY
jgi:hypothetical protein